MKNFSSRMGLKAEKSMQLNSIDIDLRIATWNLIYEVFIKRISSSCTGYEGLTWRDKKSNLARNLWINFFKKCLDEMPSKPKEFIEKIKIMITTDYVSMYGDIERYLEWNEIYDCMEFISNALEEYERKQFQQDYNKILEKENSAYRFANGYIVSITNKEEIKSIENAANTEMQDVNQHIIKATKFLRGINKDYENSIKESISAMESFFRIISDKQNATLSDILKSQKSTIHGALITGVNSIYGYSSDMRR